MLMTAIVAAIIAGFILYISGNWDYTWYTFVFCFICGLPGALIAGYIHGEVTYAQDRADIREYDRQMAEWLRDCEREDRKAERYNTPIEYHDNRQIHFHDRSDWDT